MLTKYVNYTSVIPHYASFKLGDIVEFGNIGIKKYQNDPRNGKLAIIIGYAKKTTGVTTQYAVRFIESKKEELVYDYLLDKTNETTYVPKFDVGEEVINKIRSIEGKWAKIINVDPANQKYTIEITSQGKDLHKQFDVNEKQLRFPTKKDLEYKNIHQKLPELEGIF
jgi:hypothetical protein